MTKPKSPPSSLPLRVLLTGFDPFEQASVNPSWEAVRALDGWKVGGATVHARQVPCVFGEAIETLTNAMDALKPQLVLCVGQAGGRAEITPERIAINIDDGRIADNAGHQPIDLPVVPGAPAAYFSTLPIKAIVRDLRAGGVPASVSNTAGTFVCNHLFYGLQHLVKERAVRSGCMHIPYLPEQAACHPGAPSLPLPTLVAATRLALELAVTAEEARLGGGPARDDWFVDGLGAGVVGDPGVVDVDRHPLQRQVAAPAGLADGQHHRRLHPRQRLVQPRQRLAEDTRQLDRHHARAADHLTVERSRQFPGGVDGLAAERLEPGHQQVVHGRRV